VVASGPVPNPAMYLELPSAAFANTWELATVAAAGFPRTNTNVTQGGTTWGRRARGVGRLRGPPALWNAVNAASDAGYTAGPTDRDVGAAAAFGVTGEIIYTVSVYYGSQIDAQSAQAGFDAAGIDGAVAEVQTYCLD